MTTTAPTFLAIDGADAPTRYALERILHTSDVAGDPVLANAIRIDYVVAHGVSRESIDARDPEALAAAHALVI